MQNLYMVVHCKTEPDTLTTAMVMPDREKEKPIASRERFPTERKAQEYAVELATRYGKKLAFIPKTVLDETEPPLPPSNLYVWRSTYTADGYPRAHIAAGETLTDAREALRRAFRSRFGIDRVLNAMLEEDIAMMPEIHSNGAMFIGQPAAA